jgi:hypothetical protein
MRKSEEKRPLEMPRRKRDGNIKTDFREIGRDGMDWIDLAQDVDQRRTLVNTAVNLGVPQDVGKFLSDRATGGFSRRTQLHGISQLALFEFYYST